MMKRSPWILLGTLLSLGVGIGAATFPVFSPVSGILKGSATSYVTTAAVASDVYGLWSGGCTSAKYLRGDGACSAVTLTSDVTGALPVANGGTALASYTAGDLLYASGSTTLSKLVAGTSAQVLHGGTTPSWSSVSLTADVSGTLPVASGGTNLASYTAGDLIYASGASTLSKLAAGTSAQYLAGGSTPAWTTLNTSETDATYSGTATWDSTPPSGTTSHRYSWQKQGAVVTFTVRLNYAVAGATNSSVSITFPAGMPTPVYLTGVAASDIMQMIPGGLGATSTSPNLTRQAFLRRNAAGTGFDLAAFLNSGSVSATTAWFSGTYFTTP